MRCDWEPGGPLSEVRSHLHCAVIQSLPSDDRIIMDHVKAAYTLMNSEMQKAIRGEMVRKDDGQFCCDEFREPEYFACSIANARAQAASVANPITREQLGESLDAAERVRG